MPSRRARPRPRQALHGGVAPHPSRLAVTGASLGLAATQIGAGPAAAGPSSSSSSALVAGVLEGGVAGSSGLQSTTAIAAASAFGFYNVYITRIIFSRL